MEKLNRVLSNIKSFDLSSIANDKVVVCLAFIGLAASTKYAASYLMESKDLKPSKTA